jgi:quercetin dioxygenase-like cupin family protein
VSERQVVCADLNSAIDDLQQQGFRLDLIYPADDPHTATLSNGHESVRLTTDANAPAVSGALPPFEPEFILTRAGGAAGHGRAGMLYRDLIPSRLGGRYIASHISIPGGGPVSDWVHFHKIALQFLYVRRGWVRLLYEDQGDAFVMGEGDLVLQPPEIRHRVLESSSNFEIIEIGAPAVHATFADHALELPNGSHAGRIYGGQQFLHHKAAENAWTPFEGAEAQETAMAEATGGLADVRTIRPGAAGKLDFPPHDGELTFGFVLDGSATLGGHGGLNPADSFVIPPDKSWRLSGMSPDFRLLHVTTARLD